MEIEENSIQAIDYQISESSILKLHKKVAQKPKTATNTLNILNAIGGIDKVLEDYLTIKQLQLTKQQLNQIHSILLSNNNSQNKVKSNTKPAEDLYYTFSDIDTYLHTLLGAKKANQIVHIIHNKYFQIFLLFIIVGYFLFRLFFGTHSLTFTIYCIFVSLFCIPFSAVWTLSSDKQALKIIIKSFEFWFKVTYAFICGLLQLIYFYGLKWNEWQHPYIQLCSTIFVALDIISVIACIGLIDAAHINKYWIVGVSGGMGLMFSFLVITNQLALDPLSDDSVINIASYSFSLMELIISAWRILAIFSFRQSFSTLWMIKTHNDRCISITYHPFIIWDLKAKTDYNKQKSERSLKKEDVKINLETLHHESINNDTKPYKSIGGIRIE
eukprot:310822_1